MGTGNVTPHEDESSPDFTARPLVYVAAPYSTPEPVRNTHAAIHAVAGLIDGGLVTPVVPHLTLLWHIVLPRPIDFWYAYDLALLARCDALLRLPGPSTGADNEVKFAEGAGIPVFEEEHELEEWAKAWLKSHA